MSTPDPTTTPPEPTPPDPIITPDPPLGEAGEKALQAWKDRAKAAEAEAKASKAAADKLVAAEARLVELEAASQTEQEKALTAAVNEAVERTRTEERGATQRDRFTDKLEAATAGRLIDTDLLADPDVAVKLLGLDAIPVTDTGQIDAGAILAAVDGFLEKRPHLAVSATRPAPINQGPRNKTPVIPTLADQIAEAEKAGDWSTAGSLKSQQLIELTRSTP